MIGIFRQKKPANVLLLLIFGVLIKLPVFFHPHIPVKEDKDGIFFLALMNVLQPAAKSAPVIFPLLAFVLLFTQAISLTRIMNDQRLMSRSNYLPGMAYLLITSFFPEWNYFSAPLLINSILILILSWLFKIYNNPKVKGIIFNIGLAIGICSFIFFPSITFFVWVLFALIIMRPFRINEWLLCLVGVTVPYYFYAAYLFFTDHWSWQKLTPYLSIKIPLIQQSIWIAGSSFLLMIPFLIGGYYVQDNLRRLLIQVRKTWSLLLLYLLIAIFVPFVNTSNGFENWVMAAVPFAAFHSATYFYPPRKIFPQILFWLAIAFVLTYQYYWGWS